LVILDYPSEIEKTLTHNILENAPILIKDQETISVRRQGLIEQYQLGENEPFKRVYWTEIAAILPS
jgi:cyanophycin synthetase